MTDSNVTFHPQYRANLREAYPEELAQLLETRQTTLIPLPLGRPLDIIGVSLSEDALEQIKADPASYLELGDPVKLTGVVLRVPNDFLWVAFPEPVELRRDACQFGSGGIAQEVLLTANPHQTLSIVKGLEPADSPLLACLRAEEAELQIILEITASIDFYTATLTVNADIGLLHSVPRCSDNLSQLLINVVPVGYTVDIPVNSATCD